MRRFFKGILITIIIFTLSIIVFFVGYQLVSNAVRSDMQQKIIKNHSWNHAKGNIYIQSDLDQDQILSKIDHVYDSMPNGLTRMIKDDWVVFVSDDTPCGSAHVNSDLVRGTVYYNYGIIWIDTLFEEEDFAHECGHVLDNQLGFISDVESFADIYRTSWNSYTQANLDITNYHAVSNQAEFFAMLFSEYVCHPDHLKDNLNSAYAYMQNISAENWKYSFIGDFASMYVRVGSTVNRMLTSVTMNRSFDSDYQQVETSVQQNPYIDLSCYEYVVDLDEISEDVRVIVEPILTILNDPEQYEDQIEIKLDRHISITTYCDATSFLMIYFGDMESDIFDIYTDASSEKPSTIYIDKTKLMRMEAARLDYLSRAEKVLSEMKEGTETEKLMQITKYILDNCNYALINDSDVSDFWNRKKGACSTFALTFKQFADRIGIKCDLIVTPGSKGIDHAYNRVVLADGSIRYYDLTRPNKYINTDQIDSVDYGVNKFIWQ